MSGEPRSVRWRRLLGLLPSAARSAGEELAACASSRRVYALSCQSLLFFRDKDEGDLATNNPLCDNPNSSWARFFKNEELARTVGLDLERLHPGDAFFSSEPVQRALRSVLMVYALRNPALSYRQGMHEVAALLFEVLYRDACDTRSVEQLCTSSDDTSVDEAAGPCDERYLEHDAFSLFAAVLAEPCAADASGGLGLALYYQDAPPAAPGGPSRPAPVHAALCRIWGALAAVDAPLHAHLTAAGVAPQLFMLKWLRLLFGREFHTDDVITLWEALLVNAAASHAQGRPPGEMVESVACAMVLFLRPQLLATSDFGLLLRRLQKFPPVEDVGVITERARALLPAVHAMGRKATIQTLPGDEAPPPSSGPVSAGIGFLVPAARRGAAPQAASASQAAPVAAATTPPSRFPATSIPGLAGGGGSSGELESLAACEPLLPLRPAAAAAQRVTHAAGAAARAVKDALEEDAERLAGNLRTLNSEAQTEISHALTDLNAALAAVQDGIKDSTRTAVAGAGSPALLTVYDTLLTSSRHGTASTPTPSSPPPPHGGAPPAPRALNFLGARTASDAIIEETEGGTADHPHPGGNAASSVLLAAPVHALEGLLGRLRARWGAESAGGAAEAEDAALLARALTQLRAVQARLAAHGQ